MPSWDMQWNAMILGPIALDFVASADRTKGGFRVRFRFTPAVELPVGAPCLFEGVRTGNTGHATARGGNANPCPGVPPHLGSMRTEPQRSGLRAGPR